MRSEPALTLCFRETLMFVRGCVYKRVPLRPDYLTVDINFLSHNACEFLGFPPLSLNLINETPVANLMPDCRKVTLLQEF